MTFSPASALAQALVDGYRSRGILDFVVSPGSRSQALALAVARLERADPAVRVHVRIDERDAGFVALGAALATGRPSVIITTSGTAVANLWPAVLEAHHAHVPLIVLSADRPSELHGVGSNQTTAQAGIYGFAARQCFDVAAPDLDTMTEDAHAAAEIVRSSIAVSCGLDGEDERAQAGAGPVQVNVAFREPLSGAVPSFVGAAGGASVSGAETAAVSATETAIETRPATEAVEIDCEVRTVVVAGHGAGPDAVAFATAGGVPLLAEVVSNARSGDTLIPRYRELLRPDSLGGAVEQVVVFGRPTLSREVDWLVHRAGVRVVTIDARGGEWYRPVDTATRFDRAVGGRVSPASWLAHWQVASLELGRPRDDERAMVARTVLEASADGDAIVFAASELVRVADEVAGEVAATVFANRGLSGIDGTLSTAIGIAEARGAASPTSATRLLIGDLAALHDAGGLLVPALERHRIGRLHIVVGNDRGGDIFRGLEVARADPDAFDRVVATPHDVDLAALAAAYGWPYALATTPDELSAALAGDGRCIIEFPLQASEVRRESV